MASHKRGRDHAATLESQLKYFRPQTGQWGVWACWLLASLPVQRAPSLEARLVLTTTRSSSPPALRCAVLAAAAVNPFPVMMDAARTVQQQQHQHQHCGQAAAGSTGGGVSTTTAAGAGAAFTLCSHCR
jgi:hypothetical protein